MRILAKSLCKDLAGRGFDDRDVLALASELIEEVTVRVAGSQQSMAAAFIDRRRRRA